MRSMRSKINIDYVAAGLLAREFELAVIELLADFGEVLESVLFLAKDSFEGIGDIIVAELLGKRDEVAVGSDLVVFGFLAGGDVESIEGCLIRVLTYDRY